MVLPPVVRCFPVLEDDARGDLLSHAVAGDLVIAQAVPMALSRKETVLNRGIEFQMPYSVVIPEA